MLTIMLTTHISHVKMHTHDRFDVNNFEVCWPSRGLDSYPVTPPNKMFTYDAIKYIHRRAIARLVTVYYTDSIHIATTKSGS